MPKFDLSACIVTYNNPKSQIIKTVESFLNNQLSKQLIISDNASTNSIADDMEYYFADNKLTNCQIVKNNVNFGFGTAHNIGFGRTDSKYHIVLNPDVTIHSGTIQILYDFMEKNPDIGLIIPKIFNPDGTIQELNRRFPSFFDLFARRFLPKFFQRLNFIKEKMNYYIMKDIGYDSNYFLENPSGCFMFFRSNLYAQLGGFDENIFMYMEDTDIAKRVHKISKIYYFSDASITHEWGRASHKSWKATWWNVKSALYYFNKHGWKFF